MRVAVAVVCGPCAAPAALRALLSLALARPRARAGCVLLLLVVLGLRLLAVLLRLRADAVADAARRARRAAVPHLVLAVRDHHLADVLAPVDRVRAPRRVDRGHRAAGRQRDGGTAHRGLG